MNDYEFLIPITMFTMIGLVLAAFYYFRFRARAEMQQTIRTALDKGQELSPELIDRLGEPRKPKQADLRKGVMAIAIAIAISAFGFLLNENDAERPLIAISVLPFTIGVAYLLLWKIKKPEQND